MSFLDLVGPITSTIEDIETSLQDGMQDLIDRVGKYNPNVEDFSACVIDAVCSLTASTRVELARQATDRLDQVSAEYATLQAQLREATNFRNEAQKKYDEALAKFNAAQAALAAARAAGPNCAAYRDLINFGDSALDTLTNAMDQAFGVVDKYQQEVDRLTGLLGEVRAAFDAGRRTLNTVLFAPCG